MLLPIKLKESGVITLLRTETFRKPVVDYKKSAQEQLFDFVKENDLSRKDIISIIHSDDASIILYYWA